ncbi:cation-translocating P-type ATPase [Hathewaya histolytica]|uniref:Cation-transporting ATPase, P-type n=1 Tax=Hathewaya histolytica TaxID=1498 RepID=A0A4U9RCB6_HATHI|nr:cation-translocating P-type ATPase [Hathewaya histolytica]VTQ89239.1 cation-transporting ATPase, P-type [Hathewaya histolytica]
MENHENNLNIVGLTKEEVSLRIKEGKINIIPKPPSRTLWEILRANLFTGFNAINAVLAVAVFIAGSPKDSIFAIVIVSNAIIGIYQELKAKKTLEKLSLIKGNNVKVLRYKNIENINAERLVIDDIIFLNSGDQILVDCEVLPNNSIEVDESLLTGESESILKKHGEKLLSGSFIVSGSCYAKVVSVGSNTYSSKLVEEARKFKIINSQLQNAINKIFKVVLYFIIPIGILLTFTQLFIAKRTWQDAILGSVSGIIGMIPEGLVLLTSSTFIIAIIRLSKWDTLIQELPATEVLARVDVLCLDKTGTITRGDLKLDKVVPLNDYSEEYIGNILSAIIHSSENLSQTQKAILQKYPNNYNLVIKNKISFSSSRKWEAISFKDEGSWILGAPEFILKNRYNEVSDEVEKAALEGKRVLLLAKFNGDVLDDRLNGDIEKAALLFIGDVIRENAEETVKYFSEQGVTLKIISGDNPITVSTIAKKVGIKGAENYIDARNLPKDNEKLQRIIENTTVFGRVSPYEKREIIKALKKNGHTVAMTGDGVNDILALKESDCGIAMATGSDATKAVAQLVLLNSDFSSLPHVVKEGRKLINNLEKVSELFVSKTVYSILLALIFTLILKPFPLLPIQLTFAGALTIGMPSFFLALEENNEIIKKGFLRRVLRYAIPNGVVIGISTTIMFLVAYYNGLSITQCRSISLMIFALLSLFILLKVALPINKYRLCIVNSMIGLLVLFFSVPLLRRILDIDLFPVSYILIMIIILTISMIFMLTIPKIIGKIIEKS